MSETGMTVMDLVRALMHLDKSHDDKRIVMEVNGVSLPLQRVEEKQVNNDKSVVVFRSAQ